ncbi:urea transporter [Chryseobacterium sp. 1B4]
MLGAGLSQLNGEPIKEIHMGLFGFNAVLSAIVFSGVKRQTACGCLLLSLLPLLLMIS